MQPTVTGTGPIGYREMVPGEESSVCAWVWRAYVESVASESTPEGQAEFRRFVQPEAMAGRLREGNCVLVAMDGERMVGMAEMGPDHICLLFVDRAYRRQGIGRRLVEDGIARMRQATPGLGAVTVNSSLYARAFYERLGFRATGPRTERNGITFCPLALQVGDEAGR